MGTNRGNVRAKIRQMDDTLDEICDELSDLNVDIECLHANTNDDRVSLRSVVRRFDKKLRTIEKRLDSIERKTARDD